MSYENEGVNKLNEQLAELGIKDNENRDLHNTLVYIDLLVSSHGGEGCCCDTDLYKLPHDFLVTKTEFSEQLSMLNSGKTYTGYALFDRKWYCGCGPSEIFIVTVDGIMRYLRIEGPDKINYPEPHGDVLFVEGTFFTKESTTYPLRKGFNTKSARKL